MPDDRVLETPLMRVTESLLFGLWPRQMLIFDDRIEVMRDGPLQPASESRAYFQIERVSAFKGAWFVNLLIEGPEGPAASEGDGGRRGRPSQRSHRGAGTESSGVQRGHCPRTVSAGGLAGRPVTLPGALLLNRGFAGTGGPYLLRTDHTEERESVSGTVPPSGLP